MPMFDFFCPQCDQSFEELVFDSNNPPCPKCGGSSERGVSAPSPLKTGAFPFKAGPVHPMAKQNSNLNTGCNNTNCSGCSN